jgi:signal peptidase II
MISFVKHLGLFTSLVALTFISHVAIDHFRLKVVHNSGFILGSFHDVSFYLRIVFISVLSGILAVVGSFFYTFLSKELGLLKWGLTVLLAGIAGNILEKIISGSVKDFLSVGHLYFNFNDLYQSVGIIIIIREIFAKQDLIWFPATNGRRKKLILYRDIQIPMMSKILGMISLGSLTQGFLTISLFFPRLGEGHEDVKMIYIISVLTLNAILLPLLGVYLLRELLRCMGPVYALERKLQQGDLSPIKFRKTDYFRTLEKTYNEFIAKLQNR